MASPNPDFTDALDSYLSQCLMRILEREYRHVSPAAVTLLGGSSPLLRALSDAPDAGLSEARALLKTIDDDRRSNVQRFASSALAHALALEEAPVWLSRQSLLSSRGQRLVVGAIRADFELLTCLIEQEGGSAVAIARQLQRLAPMSRELDDSIRL